MQKMTLEKIFEYASSPMHGTLSRKMRGGLKIQVNEGIVHENAVFFLGEEFVRITEEINGENVNSYYSWEAIASVRTYGKAS